MLLDRDLFSATEAIHFVSFDPEAGQKSHTALTFDPRLMGVLLREIVFVPVTDFGI